MSALVKPQTTYLNFAFCCEPVIFTVSQTDVFTWRIRHFTVKVLMCPFHNEVYICGTYLSLSLYKLQFWPFHIGTYLNRLYIIFLANMTQLVGNYLQISELMKILVHNHSQPFLLCVLKNRIRQIKIFFTNSATEPHCHRSVRFNLFLHLSMLTAFSFTRVCRRHDTV